MTFEIGQRVNVAPMSESEAEHEIVGTIVDLLEGIGLLEGLAGPAEDWYVVLLDNHLYGMNPNQEPKIDVAEDDLTLI